MNRSTLIGFGTVTTFIVAVIFGLNATHGSPVKERKTVEAAFDNVAGLMVGDDVRIASARVGYVEEMKVDDGNAVLVLKIDDPKQKVFADATAVVTDRSGFGQKFVSIDPGTTQAGETTAGSSAPTPSARRTSTSCSTCSMRRRAARPTRR